MGSQELIALYPNMRIASEAERALADGARSLERVQVVPHDGVHPASQHLRAEQGPQRDDTRPRIGSCVLIARVAAEELDWAEAVCARFEPDRLQVREPRERLAEARATLPPDPTRPLPAS